MMVRGGLWGGREGAVLSSGGKKRSSFGGNDRMIA